MTIELVPELLARLKHNGVECFPGARMSTNTLLEPPCSLKWMVSEYSLELGAFSYAVSGYYFHVKIGRYTSIGEQVQIGRGDHPTRWLSTSPAFYLQQPLFDVGTEFADAEAYQAFHPTLPAGVAPTVLKRTVIGNDVYIGHGAFVRPGVTIGDGAIVGGCAVVVKDVPPYAVVAGNPATIRRFRAPPESVERLVKVAWWQFAPWHLKGIDFAQPPQNALPALEALVPTLQPYNPTVIELKNLADA